MSRVKKTLHAELSDSDCFMIRGDVDSVYADTEYDEMCPVISAEFLKERHPHFVSKLRQLGPDAKLTLRVQVLVEPTE